MHGIGGNSAEQAEIDALDRAGTALREAILLTWSDEEEARLAAVLSLVEERRDALRNRP